MADLPSKSAPGNKNTRSASDVRDRKGNAATGASAAGARALGSQVIAFYFRAPAKAFFRTRVDYLALAKAINPHFQAQERWSLRLTTPGLLSHAVRKHGWTFIPNYVLPPLIANISVGAVLYTSYLQSLGALYPLSSQSLKRVYPPPPIQCTFAAGFIAGSIQSIVAAPLDALSIRFKTNEIQDGRYKNMWQYSAAKLWEIGPRGTFAGWSLNFLKDSLGYGAFFAAFEYVKAQAYYSFITTYYGDMRGDLFTLLLKPKLDDTGPVKLIKPHYAIEPAFLLLAGMAASISQQVVQHPLSRIADIHFSSLEYLDRQARKQQSKAAMLRSYYAAYRKTFDRCYKRAMHSGGWRRWLYKSFFISTIKQVPSTSAGLVIFELVRRRYGSDAEAVRIEKDGYDILLT